MMAEEKYPQVDKLICSKCGNDSFRFRWLIASHADLLSKALSHDGWGLQFEDSMVECSKCGYGHPYRTEDFLKIVVE